MMNWKKNRERDISFSYEKITWWELLILGLILLACLLLFYQADIVHTAVSSTAFWKGHFLDFYTYNAENGIPDSYMPSTYILFAVWTAVPYAFGFLREVTLHIPTALYFYLELLPVLFYLASGYVVCRIGRLLGMNVRQARLCAYAALTLPVALYSQFIFCQYDIFTVFFMLLGIYFYLKDDDFKFVLFFAVSITFKYFSLAVFVPMLLLKHKNWFRICGYSVLLAVPFALEILLYVHDASFVKYVMNFSALRYLFASFQQTAQVWTVPQETWTAAKGLVTVAAAVTETITAATTAAAAYAGRVVFAGAGIAAQLKQVLSAFPFQFVIAGALCVWAYFVKPKSKLELFEWVMFFGSGMMFAIFAFMFWHPQWLLLVMPFWGMSAVLSRKSRWLLLADIAFMLIFVMYVSNNWFRELDQGMLEGGIFGSLITGQSGAELMIKDCYLYYNTKVLKALTGVFMLLFAAARYPAFMIDDIKALPSKLLGTIRLRWGAGLALFLVPSLVCLVLALLPPYCTFNGEDFAGHLPGITTESWLSQVFTVRTDDAAYLEFYVYDYDRSNTGTLEVTVTDNETGALLLTYEYDVSSFPNRGWIRLELADAGLKAGGSYMVTFNSQEATPENSVTLYHTSGLTADENYYGLYDGQPLGSNLSIKIFENTAP